MIRAVLFTGLVTICDVVSFFIVAERSSVAAWSAASYLKKAYLGWNKGV